MPNPKQKPTAPYISEVLQYYERDVWTDAHANWKSYDAYYHRTYNPWEGINDPKRPTYRPSTPTNIIDHAADTQLAFEPRIHRDPIGDGEENKRRADRIEVALQAVVNDAALKEIVLPWKAAGKHLLHYGYAVIEGPLLDNDDLDAMPEEPERDKGEEEGEFNNRKALYRASQRNWNPIRIKAPNPSRVLMDPMRKMPVIAVKRDRIFSYELEALSRNAKAGAEGSAPSIEMVEEYDPKVWTKPFQRLSVIYYWTPFYKAVMLSGEPEGAVSGGQADAYGGKLLWVAENTWGFLPFCHAFAGFGQDMTGAAFDPRYQAVGLLEAIRDSIKVQSQHASATHNLVVNAAFSLTGTTLDPAQVAQAKALGGIIQGEKDSIWTEETHQVQGWMFRAADDLKVDIEQGTYSRTLGGMREAGVSTVGQQAILSTAAQRKFAGPAIQLEHMCSITLGRILQLADNPRLGQAIGARGKTLTKTDVQGNYDVTATFELIDPLLSLERRKVGLAEVTAKVKSIETYLEEDARLENVSGELDRLLKQEIRWMPEVHQALMRKTAEGMGLGEEFEEGVKIAEQQQTNGARAPSEGSEIGAALRGMRQPVAPDTAKPPQFEAP